MLKKDLAKKWHVPKKVIDDLIKVGRLNYSLVRTEKNQQAYDISDEEIQRFEIDNKIPKDPISFEETHKKPYEIANLKKAGKIKNFSKITSRIVIYSKREFQKWQ